MNDILFKRALKNSKKLLERRGCVIGKEYEADEDSEYYYEFTTPKGKPGKVVFSSQEKEGKKYVVDIFSEIMEDPKHLILVYRNITLPMMKIYRDHFKPYFKAELISIDFLQQDLFDHPYVQEYEILSAQEKKEIVKAYGGDINNHMWMLETDPVAISLKLSKGQMVKVISYYDHSLGKINKDRPPNIWYRLVV